MLKKIKSFPKLCRDSSHNPPNMYAYDPGVYAWECPSCHNVKYFVVRETRLSTGIDKQASVVSKVAVWRYLR